MVEKECPRCGLANNADVLICDCGYDFHSQEIMDSLSPRERRELAGIPVTDAAQLEAIQRKIAIKKRIGYGMSWFFLIAGMSILNMFIPAEAEAWILVHGLGSTSLIDNGLSASARVLGLGQADLHTISLFLYLLISAIFILLGILGRKRNARAVIIGMAVYSLDGAVRIIVKDYAGVLIHVIGFLGIWNGLNAIWALETLEN